MNISHILNIVEMGGYGFYVWTAWSITLSVFGFNLFLFAREKKQIKKILQHQPRQSL